MRMINYIFLLIAAAALFTSCGEGTVEIGQNTYTPKIVVQGYLYPGQKVKGIIVTRNIPLLTNPSPETVLLSGADVKLTDLEANKEYKLTFNLQNYSFEYTGNDLNIGFGKSYKLTVKAVVDGQNLSTSAITNVPNSGFKIDRQLSNIQPMYYQERDADNNIKNFSIAFEPSPGTDFYAFSMVALDASDSTFNYDNAYVDVKKEDVKKDLDNYKYQLRWLQNVNSTGNEIIYEMNWINLWFFGRYRVIVYAGDQNYKNYVLTYKMVQEFDGNFHEPQMALTGDGIGIFASVIPDTVYVEVKPKP